ncbi:hypothetical protein BD410DRAFT_790620 [Rickenella mellea]|uniref:Uncharacterized protein n=1 Tax=Rickenella mellea TaxID=50990 RepID=A0A4Y7Q054_9AGAM|nr:hypothetical protein BD410DRAFT_790620 [Rickenella mellea]
MAVLEALRCLGRQLSVINVTASLREVYAQLFPTSHLPHHSEHQGLRSTGLVLKSARICTKNILPSTFLWRNVYAKLRKLAIRYFYGESKFKLPPLGHDPVLSVRTLRTSESLCTVRRTAIDIPRTTAWGIAASLRSWEPTANSSKTQVRFTSE